jgi:hypothetical protein
MKILRWIHILGMMARSGEIGADLSLDEGG